jgi:two-component system sensor histidine kinase UhpB
MASAIEALAQALEDARAKERRLGRCLIELQESERLSLARDLHDEFGQSIAAIGLAAVYVERHGASAPPETLIECAAEIRRESGRLTDQMRERLRQLRPQGLEGAGLRDALERLIEGWGPGAPGLVVEAEIPDALPGLTAQAGLALYRTVQEALTNAAKHSGASRVRIGLTQAPGWLSLTVADDGCGRWEEALQKARGGLLGMRERAEEAGGIWRLGASPLGGLGIELRLPIDYQERLNHDPDPAARRSRGGA